LSKPALYVLAGVNGAGKSSIGGAFLQQDGLSWYNPDAFAKALIAELGVSRLQANSMAWKEGMAQLDEALAGKKPFAFETTLGGSTVCQKLKAASRTHAVRVWYCGLSSPAQHVARVRFRVSRGGHDIPEQKILERWETSRANLVELLPYLTELSVLDNSAQAGDGEPIPEPRWILHMKEGVLCHPENPAVLASTPSWAQAIVERVLELLESDEPRTVFQIHKTT